MTTVRALLSTAVLLTLNVNTAHAVEQPIPGAANPLLTRVRVGLSADDFIADTLRPFNERAGKADTIPAQAIRDQHLVATAARRAGAIGGLLRYDLNGDMRITAAEISTVDKADPPRPALAKPKKSKARPAPSEAERLMALCDFNRDGVIDVAEIVQTDDAQARPDRADPLLALLDSDLGRDGKLTRKEITALAQATFKTVDADADGFVSPEEYAALDGAPNAAQLASVDTKTTARR